MSKKKEKSVSLRDLEGEIVRLEGTEEIESGPSPPSGLKELFGELLLQQSQQHEQLLSALTTSNQATTQAVVSAVKETLQPAPQPAPRNHAISPAGLFHNDAPSVALEHEGDLSSEEECDFPG